MASSGNIRFYALAARIRQALDKTPTEQKTIKSSPALVPPNEASFSEYEGHTDDRAADQTSSPSIEPQIDYLFNETGIKVSAKTIEFGKFTYVLKHLASTKRADKVPRRLDYQIGIAITLIALVAVIVYIFTGKLTFGLIGVGFLVAGLLAFVSAVIAYQQLKSSHTIVFKDANGNIIQSVMRRDKAVIDRLERAVKIAVSGNLYNDT